MLSESVLLPPLFQSALRYFMFLSSCVLVGILVEIRAGWQTKNKLIVWLFSPKCDAQAGLTGNSGVHSVKKPKTK